MSKLFTHLSASLCVTAAALFADAPMEFLPEAPAAIETPSAIVQMPIEESAPVEAPSITEEPKTVAKKVEKTPEISVNPFTGKIKGRKVRMRLKPDVDSRIIKELNKNDLVTVIAEKGDFWAVQAPAGTKAYIFRSFVLDDVVEGNRVNIRLEPSMDAPIIAHMNSGEKVENPSISPVNTKWLEIAPPAQTRFYIAKEYVSYAGGPEVKAQMDRKASTAEQLLDATSLLSKAELRKSFEEIDFDRIVKGYNTVIADFNEFPDLVEQAKEALATFQETYLQRRLAHQEPQEKQMDKKATKFENIAALTDKMKLWEPIEEALYLSWSNINDNKGMNDYYTEQKLVSVEIAGIVEPYNTPVKNKPGDFIVREKDVPVAYVYSTQVNLQSLVGKQVKLTAAPRPNNNFAFPAYYVLTAE